MELMYARWFKENLEKLVAKFNDRKTNPVERFAALTAIRNQLRNEVASLDKELVRYEQFAVEEMSK